MKLIALFVVLLSGLGSLVWAQTKQQKPKLVPAPTAIADGEYVGMEPMPSQDPGHPDEQWFYEVTIVLRGGDLLEDKLPVAVRGGEKAYSASDGGFATYRGRFEKWQDKLYLRRRMSRSDYLFFSVGKDSCEPYSRVQILPVKVAEDGFWIEGVHFVRKRLEDEAKKALEHELQTTSLAYDPKQPYSRKAQLPLCLVDGSYLHDWE